MDRFSHLLIYTALRCLSIGGEELWQRYDNQENLLFREEDFLHPSKSRLLHELWELPDREVRALVGHLLLASQGPLDDVPTLDELFVDNGTRPLSDVEEARVVDLLDESAAHPSGDRKGAVGGPFADARRSDSSVRTKIQTRVRTTDLDDTSIIPRGVKTAVMPVPPTPQSPRRSAAEIERDAQPPPAADHLPHDPERPDPLVSMLSHPAWLATLGVIALISFFVVIVMVWSTVPHSTTVAAVQRPDVEKGDEKPLPPPVREVPRLTPPRFKQEIGPPAAVPKAATRIYQDDTSKVRKEIPRLRLKEDIPNSLSLEAGARSGLWIALDRNGYDGTVEILLTGLPPSISARPAAIPAPLSSATVIIETKVDTEKGEYPIKLLVRRDNQTIEERAITLFVQQPRGWQEKVHFSTVDHMHLGGTLYHGWKSKRGLTVLMLHDLGSNRSSPGWKRLAETLQAEGHTVLTFDFRGHGDSRKVSASFWRYPVNKYLNSYKLNTIAELQPTVLRLDDFPSEYRPWLIEDIAAARTYLDRLHDDPASSVNTFNLVVLGAGQAAALGSLWLATEGLRYNGSNVGNKIQLRWEEKRSVLQAVWIGMADPLKLRPFGIHSWLEGAHAKPVVPIAFIYGEEDIDTYTLLSEPIRKKFGVPFVISGVRQSGQGLLDTDTQAATRIQKYLVKTFQTLPPTSTAPVSWVPRKTKSLRSFWRLEIPKGKKTVVRWFEAKRVGEESLLPVPFLTLGIPIKGLEESNFITDDEDDP
jgi:pimeloyl-ACP methyl ester carboxylesterase